MLTIKPIEYSGRRLQELGDRVTTAFYPSIENFKVADRISLRNLLFDGAVEPDHTLFLLEKYFSRHYGVAFYGFSLGNFLGNFGRMVLGVTDVPMTFSEPKSSYRSLIHQFKKHYHKPIGGLGTQVNDWHLAAVSTHKSEFGVVDSDQYIDRLVKLAIHEVGHSFGLDHHRRKYRTPAGNPCPMTENGDIGRADDILCLKCYEEIFK